MNSPLDPVETTAFVAMGLWLLGNLLYTLPFSPLRWRLERINLGLWFANWTVFGAGDERAGIASYTVEYRDQGGSKDAAWVQVMRGRPWRWHAFLWQPDRRLADRLHRLAEGIARTPDFNSDAARNDLARRTRLLANHVEAVRPRPPGTKREIRISMKRALIADRSGSPAWADDVQIEEKVLMMFSPDAVADER